MRLQPLPILQHTGRRGGLGINPLKYEEILIFKVAFICIISYLMTLSFFVITFQDLVTYFSCVISGLLFGVLTSITVEAGSCVVPA